MPTEPYFDSYWLNPRAQVLETTSLAPEAHGQSWRVSLGDRHACQQHTVTAEMRKIDLYYYYVVFSIQSWTQERA